MCVDLYFCMFFPDLCEFGFLGGWEYRGGYEDGHDSPETCAHQGGHAEARGLGRCSPKALIDQSEFFFNWRCLSKWPLTSWAVSCYPC